MTRKAPKAVASALLSLLLLLVATTAASAAPPSSIHIEVLEYIGQNGESFAATGAVCPSGTVEDLSTVASGPPSGPYTILHVLKRFSCGDASGTFDISLVVRLNNATHYTTAHWWIVDGSGDYADLSGNGSLAGTPVVPGISIYDVYDGMAH